MNNWKTLIIIIACKIPGCDFGPDRLKIFVGLGPIVSYVIPQSATGSYTMYIAKCAYTA